MASKWEDQKGTIVNFASVKCEMGAQEGGNAGALLSVISFDWQGREGELFNLPAQLARQQLGKSFVNKDESICSGIDKTVS